jgi:hypothetical protein
VAIDAFTVMGYHFHRVVYFDPQDSDRWTYEIAADRSLCAFPPQAIARSPEDQDKMLSEHRAILVAMPDRLLHARKTLGSSSRSMKHPEQPIAYLANKEDHCTGHFVKGRFYSCALLDESAVVAAMSYVDLNPVCTRIISDIAAYQHTSGYHRANVTKV